MISYKGYSNDALRNSLLKLKASPRASDFPVIEQIERELRNRGKDPSNSYYGRDVLGSMIKIMKMEQTKVLTK